MSPSVRTIESWILATAFALLGALLILVMLGVSAYAQIVPGPNISPNGFRFTFAPRAGYLGPPAAVFPMPWSYQQAAVPLVPPLFTPFLPPFLPPALPPPPPLAYAPAVPIPLGWIWGRYAPCGNPECDVLVVQVSVDGLNVRATPEGPIVAALANGTPVTPLTKVGPWVLVSAAPGCWLTSTFTASVTAGGVPLSVCL